MHPIDACSEICLSRTRRHADRARLLEKPTSRTDIRACNYSPRLTNNVQRSTATDGVLAEPE